MTLRRDGGKAESVAGIQTEGDARRESKKAARAFGEQRKHTTEASEKAERR